MKKRHRNELEEPQINLTPLIDVVFVVLIMFIVIAPLLEMEKVNLASGVSEKSNELSENCPLSIFVLEDNTVKINQSFVPLNELCEKIAALKKVHPQARPRLFHDKKAAFGTYQIVKTAVQKAGFEEMDLILKPD